MNLTVATYNVHGCKGRDRTCDPGRIAAVIKELDADIVALQEVDEGRPRSDHINQHMHIADLVGMKSSFYATFQDGPGHYGGALLSRREYETVRTGMLPGRPRLEPRGALWVRVPLTDTMGLDVINTHLGLRFGERADQVHALLGKDWLGNSQFTPPAILLGDFNLSPLSPLYRRICRHMHSVRDSWRSVFRMGTFLGVVPIDHIFVSSHIGICNIRVHDSPAARQASDHLPFVCTLDVDTG
ncbi:MAG: endonuclease/exonuclease/phosphatase family protein [Candidatus Hydrogenedentes bacterium]|nr:endonuclease/exonuclease/phosphatase family protein [Candidatus Hydrogenedentota bacterium]